MKTKKVFILLVIVSFSIVSVYSKQAVPRKLGPGTMFRHGILYEDTIDIQRLGPVFILMYDYMRHLLLYSVLEFYNVGKLNQRITDAGLTGRLDLSGLGIKNLYGLDFVVDKVNGFVTELDLGQNSISKIDPKHFPRNLYRLKSLDLSDNKITFLPNGCFDKLRELEYINLNDNPLLKLKTSHFKWLPKLKEVYPKPSGKSKWLTKKNKALK